MTTSAIPLALNASPSAEIHPISVLNYTILCYLPLLVQTLQHPPATTTPKSPAAPTTLPGAKQPTFIQSIKQLSLNGPCTTRDTRNSILQKNL